MYRMTKQPSGSTQRQNKFKLMPVAALLLAMTVFVAGTQTGADGISAYLTYRTVDLDNNTTIALDTITTVIEKYPDPVPKLDGTVASYEKAVQFGNIGFIDAYVRAKIEFTEADIESKTKFSWDGVNYYSVSEYKNHLPDGWVYHDGYYYYTPILAAGDWDTISADLIWDEDLGEYFYHENDELKVCDEITVPLIRYVKTTFDNVKDLRTYELSVSEESVPFYFGDDYMSAWTAYIEGMGDPVMQ